MNQLKVIVQKRILLVFILVVVPFALSTVILFKIRFGSQQSKCPPSIAAYWSFNAHSSKRFSDIYGANATCIDCPEVVANGRLGGGLSFDGVDDQLTVSDEPLFEWQEGQSFTIEGWISSTMTSGVQVVISKGAEPLTPSPNNAQGERESRWQLALSDERATFYLADSVGIAATLESTSQMTDGKWHHLAVIRDKSLGQVRLYVDGRAEDTATVGYQGDFSNSGELTIGSAAGGAFFKGGLDEVALHDRALSAKEIRQHYHDGVVGLGRGYCACDTVHIMPLGDSITRGTYLNNENPTDEEAIGYRLPLYRSLSEAGYTVDFVGTVKGGTSIEPAFDTDHEGHGGYQPQEIRNDIPYWLEYNPPDLILLHIGTNGLNSTNPLTWTIHISETLNHIDAHEREVGKAIPVLLARIINHQSGNNPDVYALNDYIQRMAERRLAKGDRLLIVDHEHALSYPIDMHNTLHPTDTGYIKMADAWLDGLDDILSICP
jgi:lysophospholipase L1-like esterase